MKFNEIACVERLGPRLYRYFYLTFTPAESSDLVQETLLRLWQKISKGQVKKIDKEVEMYAFGIARNVRKEQRRKLGRTVAVDESFLRSLPEEDMSFERLEGSLKLRKLRHAMMELKDIEREILTLVIDKTMKLEEISTLMQMPVGTVKSHVFRAKENLKRLLLTNIGSQDA